MSVSRRASECLSGWLVCTRQVCVCVFGYACEDGVPTSLLGSHFNGLGEGPVADGGEGEHRDGVGAVRQQVGDGRQLTVVHLVQRPQRDGQVRRHRVVHLEAL